MRDRLNYGDFARTGYQDCANVFNTSDHNDAWERLGKPQGSGAAKKIVREAWGNDEDQYDQWLSQADVDGILKSGLELRAAYRAWRDAWQSCAESAVKADMQEWIASEAEDR